MNTDQPLGGRRTVGSQVSLQVTEPADLVLSVAVAATHGVETEHLTITVAGAPVPVEEVRAAGGTRLHRLPRAPVGRLEVAYTATTAPAVDPDGPGHAVTPLEHIEFTRPSRYCDSDRLAVLASTHFGHLAPADLVEGVRSWVLGRVLYAPGSSGPVDGALETYLSRRGVCRDSAHLVITFLRSLGVPARLVSVYAPGLSPMDFHAVVEARVDGRWVVLDATGLAPRRAMVRVATGRDAADTAFLTVLSGRADFIALTVTATYQGPLPTDDGRSVVALP